MGKIRLYHSLLYNGLRHSTENNLQCRPSFTNRRLRLLYSAPTKTQVFYFVLSSHHPNNPLENTSIFFIFPSSTKQPKLYSHLEKIFEGICPPTFNSQVRPKAIGRHCQPNFPSLPPMKLQNTTTTSRLVHGTSFLPSFLISQSIIYTFNNSWLKSFIISTLHQILQ